MTGSGAPWLVALMILAVVGAVGPPVGRVRRPPGWPVETALLPDSTVPWWTRWDPRRTSHRVDRSLPGLVDELIRSLQSGSTLAGALVEAADDGGPVSADLQLVGADLRSGAPLGVALSRWAERRPGTRVGQLVAAVDLAVTTGGEPSRLLGTVGEAIRDELEVSEEARALATQARSSAAVVALAPVGFAMMMAPSGTAGFLTTGPGMVVLALGLVLDGVGLWWMWRLSGSPVVGPPTAR